MMSAVSSGGGAFEGAAGDLDEGLEDLLDGGDEFVGGDRDSAGEAAGLIAAADFGADRLFDRDGPGGGELELFGGAFADQQAVAALDVFDDRLGDDVSADAGGVPDDDAVHGEDGGFGAAGAEVADERAAGVAHGDAGADGGGEWVGDQMGGAAGAGLFDGVADGALLDVGDAGGGGDHDFGADEVEASGDERNIVAEQGFDDAVVVDHALAHGADDADEFGGAADHVGGVAAGGEDGVFLGGEGDDGGFVDDDAAAASGDGDAESGGAEIDAEPLGEHHGLRFAAVGRSVGQCIEGGDQLNVCAEGAELAGEVGVAAGEVVDAVDAALAVGGEGGDDERGGGADVGAAPDRAGEPGGTEEFGAAVFADAEDGAELAQSGEVLHSVLEDAFVDDGAAGGLGEEGGHGRLEVGGEAGIGECLDVGGVEAEGGAGVELDLVGGAPDLRADLVELGERQLELVGICAAQEDAAARGGGGDEQRAGLDAVGDQLVVDAGEAVDAVDCDCVVAGAGDARAHAGEEVGEADDFGFHGGVDDACAAAGEDGGKEQVLGAQDAGIVEHDVRAAEAVGGAGDGAAVDRFDACAEGAEAGEVDVEGSRADVVAAGRAAGRLAAAGEEGAHDEEGGAQGGDEMVGRRAAARADGVERDCVVLEAGVNAEAGEDFEEAVDVLDVGDAAQAGGLVGEEGGGETGEGGVLCAVDAEFTGQPPPAGDAEKGFGVGAHRLTVARYDALGAA